MDHFGCTAVYHTYCCDPPLARPPPGDWFCPACRKLFELQDIDKLMDVRWAGKFHKSFRKYHSGRV